MYFNSFKYFGLRLKLETGFAANKELGIDNL